MIVGIDTMILIWGLQKPHRKGKTTKQNVAEMRKRAKILLKTLSDQQDTVIVSMVSVGELLCGIDKKDHGPVSAEVSSRFFCAPLDLRATAKAAELFQLHEAWSKEEQYAERPLLRSDTFIVASAWAAGAHRFFSHDAGCRRMAEQAGMKPHDLPTHAENYFIEQEIEEEDKK